jgi:hypothetical protein
MPGETGVTVVIMLVCFFISHARLRAHWAPGIPCALCFRGKWLVHNSGASRRESAKSYPLGCLKIESEICGDVRCGSFRRREFLHPSPRLRWGGVGGGGSIGIGGWGSTPHPGAFSADPPHRSQGSRGRDERADLCLGCLKIESEICGDVRCGSFRRREFLLSSPACGGEGSGVGGLSA